MAVLYIKISVNLLFIKVMHQIRHLKFRNLLIHTPVRDMRKNKIMTIYKSYSASVLERKKGIPTQWDIYKYIMVLIVWWYFHFVHFLIIREQVIYLLYISKQVNDLFIIIIEIYKIVNLLESAHFLIRCTIHSV